MYAHALRKWSLAKILMYLWLPVLMLLALMCSHGAATVTPNTSNLHYHHQQQQQHLQHQPFDDRIADYVARYGLQARLRRLLLDEDNVNDEPMNIAGAGLENTATTAADEVVIVPNVPKHIDNSQIIINVSDFLNSGSVSSRGSVKSSSKRREDDIETIMLARLSSTGREQRFERVVVNDNTDNYYDNRFSSASRRHRRRRRPSIGDVVQSPHRSERKDDNDDDGSSITVTSPSESLAQSIWALRLQEKQARIATHRQQLALASSSQRDHTTIFNDKLKDNLNTPIQQLQPPQHDKKITDSEPRLWWKNEDIEGTDDMDENDEFDASAGRNRRESRHQHDIGRHHTTAVLPPPRFQRQQRRFCSARDPKTLAFEAPTVFEGKVKSMSSDRRKNFSVTFEVMRRHKEQPGYRLPALVRLPFTYRNTSECDIYRESFKARGYVREELEQGKVYILFVEQLDVGNYTILGQPIRRTRRTVMEVRQGVDEKYGESLIISFFLFFYLVLRLVVPTCTQYYQL